MPMSGQGRHADKRTKYFETYSFSTGTGFGANTQFEAGCAFPSKKPRISVQILFTNRPQNLAALKQENP